MVWNFEIMSNKLNTAKAKLKHEFEFIAYKSTGTNKALVVLNFS